VFLARTRYFFDSFMQEKPFRSTIIRVILISTPAMLLSVIERIMTIDNLLNVYSWVNAVRPPGRTNPFKTSSSFATNVCKRAFSLKIPASPPMNLPFTSAGGVDVSLNGSDQQLVI
jgi:hypothetical protein